MKAVIQRCERASVSVDGKTVAAIGRGYLTLLGVERGDNAADAAYIADKLLKLRVFEDENGKMNISLPQLGGEMLIISQFTLITDIPVGNRPYFGGAEEPDAARTMYDLVCETVGRTVPVKKGVFGAHMSVELVNDGPVTIIINSRDKLKREEDAR